MQAAPVQHPAGLYLSVTGQPGELASGEAALELVGFSWEHAYDLCLLDGALLPPAFFDLSSGLAGELLQKFSNYHLRVAAVLPDITLSERFQEFMAETNRGRIFGLFTGLEAAQHWLLSSP